MRAVRPGAPRVGATSIAKKAQVSRPTPKVRQPSAKKPIPAAPKTGAPRANLAVGKGHLRSKPKTVSKASLRQRAVRQAKSQEQQLVRLTGKGTRDWTPRQLDMIKKGRRVPGYVGHHIKDVHSHKPKWAGDPRNIAFVTQKREHLQRHRGHFRNPTRGKLIDRQKMIRMARNNQQPRPKPKA